VAPSGRVDCEDWWRCPCPAGVADGLTAIGLGDLATRLRPTLVTLCCRLILFVTTDRACSPVWTAISGQEPGLLFVKSDRTRRAEVIRAKEMQGVGRGQRPAAAGRLGAVRTDEHQPRRKSGAVTGHEHVRSVVVSKISRPWSTRARGIRRSGWASGLSVLPAGPPRTRLLAGRPLERTGAAGSGCMVSPA
jgi:hypothetical protein